MYFFVNDIIDYGVGAGSEGCRRNCQSGITCDTIVIVWFIEWVHWTVFCLGEKEGQEDCWTEGNFANEGWLSAREVSTPTTHTLLHVITKTANKLLYCEILCMDFPLCIK